MTTATIEKPGLPAATARPLSEYDDDELVPEKVACKFIGTTAMNMARLRSAKVDHPPHFKGAKSVRYRVGDLREFVKARTVHSGPHDDGDE